MAVQFCTRTSLGRLLMVSCFLLVFSCPADPAPRDGETISLEKALEIALENNPRLRAARHGVRASQFRVQRSRRDLLPKADLQFAYTRLDPGTVRRGNVFVEVARSLVRQFGQGDPNDIRPGAYDNNFSTVFQIVQPIYNGGANFASMSVAKAQHWSQEQQLEDTKQEILLAVKTRYLRVLQAQELVSLAQQSLKATEEHLTTARHMLEVGLRSKTEVLRWEVQKASDEGRLVEAENRLEIAFASLKEVMGVPFEQTFQVTPLAFVPEPVTQKFEEQWQQTRRHHPALKMLEASLDAQRAGVRLAASALQPKVNFVYQLSWERNNTLALDSFSFWSASVQVNVPLFHSFSNIARVQEAKAELNRAEEMRTVSERALTLQLIQARSKVKAALKRFHVAEKAVEQAKENLEVVNNSFDVGLASNLDVLDAQVAFNQAQTDLINARYDYWIARAELDRALGALSE